MRNVAIAVLAGALVAGCANQQMQPGETYDRIGQELKGSADSKPRTPAADAVGRAMMPPLLLEEPVAAAKPEPRFDLAVNNAPATQVFMALVSGTRYSMLFPPELTGSITLNLKGVTVREALEAIRDIYGYEYKIQGSRITIQPNTLQSRIYQINYLAGRRQGVSDMRITSSSPSVVNPGGSTAGGAGTTGAVQPAVPAGAAAGALAGALPISNIDASRVRTTSDQDFWRDLRTAVETIVGGGEGRNVIVNPTSGVALVKAMPAELRAVESYLKATQLMVERQVMLEAKILDVRLSESFQTGINWAKFTGNDRRWAIGNLNRGSTTLGTTGAIVADGSFAGTGRVSATPGGGGAITGTDLGRGFFGLAFQTADFSSLLSFLETQGDVQVLSSPRIATINNQKAVLKVGSDEYFVTNLTVTPSTSTTGGAVITSTVTPTLQPFFSGISLDVTPQIDDQGNIILHVHPAVTVVREIIKQLNLGSNNGGQVQLPLASSTINETDSIVRVQDGTIVAIGGLMSQEQSNDRAGLPGTTRDPILGSIFGQRSSASSKRELVILMKATVIQDAGQTRQDVAEVQDRIQAMDPRRIPTQAQ